MTAHATYSRKEVVQIIQSVMTNVMPDTDQTRKLREELQALSSYIESMRSELAQLRSIEISHNHIPTVTDELDAVVGETAKATGTIMDACDKVQAVADGIGGDKGTELGGIVTSIYEACSFQDITGQRITKVVKTVKNIESKVAEILSAFGHAVPGEAPAAAPSLPEKASLLNGPQLKGPAVSQADIDKLLADFDK
jgi:chemotaxis protein CheZ